MKRISVARNSLSSRHSLPNLISIITAIAIASLGQSALAQVSPADSAPDVEIPAEVRTYDLQFQMRGDGAISDRIEYLCPMVESYAAEMLKRMGASEISTHCVDPNSPDAQVPPETPIYMPVVTVHFKAVAIPDAHVPSPVMAIWQEVSLIGGGNCVLALELFKKLQPSFEVEQVHGAKSCGFENGVFKFSMLALIPAAS